MRWFTTISRKGIVFKLIEHQISLNLERHVVTGPFRFGKTLKYSGHVYY